MAFVFAEVRQHHDVEVLLLKGNLRIDRRVHPVRAVARDDDVARRLAGQGVEVVRVADAGEDGVVAGPDAGQVVVDQAVRRRPHRMDDQHVALGKSLQLVAVVMDEARPAVLEGDVADTLLTLADVGFQRDEVVDDLFLHRGRLELGEVHGAIAQQLDAFGDAGLDLEELVHARRQPRGGAEANDAAGDGLRVASRRRLVLEQFDFAKDGTDSVVIAERVFRFDFQALDEGHRRKSAAANGGVQSAFFFRRSFAKGRCFS